MFQRVSSLVLGVAGVLGEDCITDTGDKCIFPFIYQGVTYHSCSDTSTSRPWCATQVDKQGKYVEGQWGYCTAGDCSDCGPPPFTSRYIPSRLCEAWNRGAVCTPKCGSAWLSSPALPITCTTDGWTTFQGCDSSYVPGNTGHPQCIKENSCDDDDPCTYDWCDLENRCESTPKQDCIPCKKSSDCPSYGKCSTGKCGAHGLCIYNQVTISGKMCVFPFKLGGFTYTQCTMEGADAAWCATSVDAKGNYQDEWDFCAMTDCQGQHDCGAPVWNDQYQDPGNCIETLEGSMCMPTCGRTFQDSEAGIIECNRSGWSAFSGCAATAPSPAAEHSCVAEGVCSDDNDCTTDYCAADQTCLSVPKSDCLACSTADACPASASCGQVRCKVLGGKDARCQYDYSTDLGQQCVFPFVYEGLTFHQCTKFGEEHYWCATGVDQQLQYVRGKWGFCLSGGCVAPKDCGPPPWTSRYNRNPDCLITYSPNTCTPRCGLGWQVTPAGTITCRPNGRWSDFSGCDPTARVIAPHSQESYCSSDQECVDRSECTQDFCNSEKRCESLPASNCYTCQAAADCPAGGPGRAPSCQNGKCVYKYTQCWDGDECTADFFYKGQCNHQEFIKPPNIKDSDAALVCSPLGLYSMASFQLSFDASKYQSSTAILRVLQICSGYGGKQVKSKLAVRDYVIVNAFEATATALLFQAPQEHLPTLYDDLLRDIATGNCGPDLRKMVNSSRLYDNCAQAFGGGAFYAEQCMADEPELLPLQQSLKSLSLPVGQAAGRRSPAGKVLGVLFLLSVLLGTAAYLHYKHKQDGKAIKDRARDSLTDLGVAFQNFRSRVRPVEEEQNGEGGEGEQEYGERKKLGEANHVSNEEEGGGNKNKGAFSYSPGGTRYNKEPVYSAEPAPVLATRHRSPFSSAALMQRSPFHASSPQPGNREGGDTLLRGGLDNSRFADLAAQQFDEDEVDPMIGWSNRQETEFPPELVQVAITIDKNTAGPRKIMVVCKDETTVHELLLECCRKIDHLTNNLDTDSGAVENMSQYMLYDPTGRELTDSSDVGNLQAQLRSVKTTDGKIFVSLIRLDG